MSDSSLTLTEIESAIRKILTTGQSYSIGGRTFTRASLGDLRSMRKEVIAETTNKGGSRGFVFDSSGGASTEADDWGDD